MSVYTCSKTGRLFIQFVYQGKTYKKRLPAGSTKTDAQKLETKLKHELFFDKKKPVDQAEVLWESFVDTVYLEYVAANHSADSLEKAILVCKASMAFFKGMPLNEIKPADVERFKAERMATPTRHGHPRKPATIHREISIISKVFEIALRNDLVPYNPVRRIDLPVYDNTQDRVCEDVDLFLRCFRNSLQRDICTVVLYSGLRQNDVLGLTKDKVNWHTGQIVLIQGKTKRRVVINMHPRVIEVLARRMSNAHELFFPSYRSGQRLKSIKNAIAFACERAGIPKLTMRDLRRTFGTMLHEEGYDDKTVADCLGHTDTRSVYRYKRGTQIQKTAVLNLEYPARIPTTPQDGPLASDANSLQNMVEMRRIELLASALRTPQAVPNIH